MLIFEKNIYENQHEQHVRSVLQKLKDANLFINVSKCEFGTKRVTFLGHEISSEGWKPPEDRVDAIKNYPQPKTIVELRRFVGILNFYRKFIPNAAELQSPLNSLFKKRKKNDKTAIEWTQSLTKSFNECEESLANSTILNFIDQTTPLRLTTDASDVSVGAHLEQKVHDQWSPVGFFSSKLKVAQKNYSIYDRELLAIYLCIKYFKHILDGREFVIRIKHKPLVYCFRQKSNEASPRKFRHL